MTQIQEIHVHSATAERLDIYLANQMPHISRSKIKQWCKEGRVLVDGKPRKASSTIAENTLIRVAIPKEKSVDHIEPEELPLEVIFEDEHLIIINKQPGMVVHPGAGVHSGTLVNALAFHFTKLATRGGSMRPGIVHRLDKGTSGLILAVKSDAAHQHLSEQWQAGQVTKVYQALVWGIPDPPEGEIETHIGRHPKYRQLMAAETEGGRWSKSRYKVKQGFTEASKVHVHILTGRTHQIRVHMAHIGHPVVGDALYGKNRHKNLAKVVPFMPERPMLHAALLRFKHPATQEEVTFQQPPPEDFLTCAHKLSEWPY